MENIALENAKTSKNGWKYLSVYCYAPKFTPQKVIWKIIRDKIDLDYDYLDLTNISIKEQNEAFLCSIRNGFYCIAYDLLMRIEYVLEDYSQIIIMLLDDIDEPNANLIRENLKGRSNETSDYYDWRKSQKW